MRITENSPQWLGDLAKDNLRREIELHNRQHKADAKDRDICLRLLHNGEYRRENGLILEQRENGLILEQNSLVPLDYPHNTVKVI